ncbi:MAG: polysaccharide deacetylase family protein [Oscillospiraceae bacterium]
MEKFKIALLSLLALLVVAAAVFFAANPRDKNKSASDGSKLPSPQGEIEQAAPTDNLPVTGAEDSLPVLSNQKIGWGCGNHVNERNQTTDSVDAQIKYADLGAYFVFPDADKTICLTFDLGYENGYTPAILDALENAGVKGTFFITMQYVKEAPDIVRRIIADGHTLANHSVHHPSMPGISSEKAAAEVTVLHDYIEKEFGYSMKLFRFPMGEFSENTLSIVNSLGYKSVFWSFAYRDWLTDAQPDPASSVTRLAKAAHPGAIYLLHTVSSTNAKILPELIERLRADGYSFSLVTTLAGLDPPLAKPRGETILN